MSLRAIIIDDELKGRETLAMLISRYCPLVEVLGTADFATTGATLIAEVKPDLIFLDIEMPDGTGFDIFEKFPKHTFEVIFTTAYDQYACKAFRYNALDYLLKPIYHKDLTEAVQKAARRISERESAHIANDQLYAQIQAEMEKARKESETQQLRAEQLQTEMERKNKELTVMALQLVQKNKGLAHLKEKLGGIRITGKKNSREIMKEVQATLGPEDTWEIFSRQFQQVHEGFITHLAQLYPTLTPTELKICSLIKINLSSKDIANLLYITVRTVELHRVNIRKKMQLPSQTSLSTFIIQL